MANGLVYKGSVWGFEQWVTENLKGSQKIKLEGNGEKFTGKVKDAVNFVEESFSGSDKLNLKVVLA